MDDDKRTFSKVKKSWFVDFVTQKLACKEGYIDKQIMYIKQVESSEKKKDGKENSLTNNYLISSSMAIIILK